MATSWVVPPPRHFSAALTGGDPRLYALELWYPARYGDATWVLKPILLLGFSQQLTKQWVVEVYHRHKDSLEVAVFLTHVHRQMTFRNRRRWHLLTHRKVTGETSRTRVQRTYPLGFGFETLTPVAESRNGLGLAGRLPETVVPRWVSASPEKPSAELDDPFS